MPLVLLLCLSASTQAEVLVRWDQDQIPSPESLGISTLVIPAKNSAAVQNALTQGYRVFLEMEASTLTGLTPLPEGLAGVVLKGKASPKQLLQLRQRLKSPGARVLTLEERGKWPHIRSNWVTRNREILQVTGRSAQPWIDSNAALLRILHATHSGSTPWLTYQWEPITLSEIDEGPGLENYLVAIAEAGSFGGNLLLPLHDRFQRDLLLGKPQTRAEWNEIRRSMEFYSWNLPGRYQPIANVGVVTAEPMPWFEVMNLLARHNLLFEVIAPARLPGRDLASFEVLIVLTQPQRAEIEVLAEFARKGGAVVLDDRSASADGTARPWRSGSPILKTEDRVNYRFGEGRVMEVQKGIPDPNTFALEVRQIIGREHRVIDIWNGITVLTAPYEEPNGSTVLVTALNYAHQPLPVQLRIRGTFSLVHYESPDEPPALLPHEHREGYTEFVLPALRIGGRVFLSRIP